MQRPYRQHGVALITAMVITAIAVTIAATLVYKQQVAIRLSGNMAALEQAYQYATGMEDWAGIILNNDIQENETDSKEDIWAMLLPPIPLPGGQMNGQLFDLQSRLNLNDLVIRIAKKGGEIVYQPNEPQVERLKLLLTRLGLLTTDGPIDSLVDWLDADSQESDNGAESGYYKTLSTPYLAANSSLVSLSELRMVKGFNEKLMNEDGVEEIIFDKVKPFVTVLPKNALKINVNTAEYEVLYALGLDDSQISNVISDREEEPFSSVDDFVSSLGIQNSEDFPRDNLSVTSEYFLLQGLVQIGRVRVFINSVIHRDASGRTRIVSREFSES